MVGTFQIGLVCRRCRQLHRRGGFENALVYLCCGSAVACRSAMAWSVAVLSWRYRCCRAGGDVALQRLRIWLIIRYARLLPAEASPPRQPWPNANNPPVTMHPMPSHTTNANPFAFLMRRTARRQASYPPSVCPLQLRYLSGLAPRHAVTDAVVCRVSDPLLFRGTTKTTVLRSVCDLVPWRSPGSRR